MIFRVPAAPAQGRLALALAVATISWGSILVRLCASPPLAVAFWRLALASAFLVPWLIPAWRVVARDPALAAASGGAGLLLALHFAAWIASLGMTSIAASTLLVSTQPVFSVVISAALLRERPSARAFLAIALALAGMGIVAWGDLRAGAGRLGGDLLAVAAAAAAAAYLVIGRAVRDAAPLPVYLLLVNGSAALAAGALAVGGGQALVEAPRADALWLLLMAAGPHLLGHGALNFAVRRMPAWIANLAVLGEPPLAILYAFLIFGERPPPGFWPGALLIAAGVALALRDEPRREERSAAL